ADAPAAREAADRIAVRLGREPQAVEQRTGARVGRIAAALVEPRVRLGNGVSVLSGLGAGQSGLGRAQALIAVDDVFDGRAIQVADFLGHVANGPVVGQ